MENYGRRFLNILRTCNYRDKLLVLPLTAAMAFIFFAARYMPSTNKGFTSLLPFARTYNLAVLQTFSMDVVDLVNSCHKISPLVVVEPSCIKCLYGLDFEACHQNGSSPVYRFAVAGESRDTATARIGLRKIVSSAFVLGWYTLKAKTLDYIILKKDNETVLISILELRPKYWYLPELRYGRVPEPSRAFLGLNFTRFEFDFQNETQLLVPDPAEFYLWQWPRSRFLECNRTSSKYLRQKYPEIYREKPVVDDSFVEILAYTRDLFLRHRTTVFLAGGTALGWYRECGIIPHTTDTDMAFLISEWKPELEHVLQNDNILLLYWILGKPDDGLEITVYARSNKIDIFALYEFENASFVGAMDVSKKMKLRWWYPQFTGACAADLKGELFYVRCDILDALVHEYGPRWYEHHHSKDYVWHSSHHNVERVGVYDATEWPLVYRKFETRW